MIAPADQPGLVWLIGMPGAGKSTVGRMLAGRTGRPFVDLDRRIEQTEGRPLADIFASDGEAAFREREGRAVRELAASGSSAVVATGGGAPCFGDTLRAMKRSGLVLWLRSDQDEIFTRIDWTKRPLLARAADPRLAFAELEASRRGVYGDADVVVERQGRDSATIAGDLAAWLEGYGAAPLASALGEEDLEVPVSVGEARYPILIDRRPEAAARFAHHLGRRRPPGQGAVALLTDENVGRLHGARYLAALQQRGYAVVEATVPAGEASKSLRRVEEIAERLVAGGLDRGSTLIALGGGVVGDLGGLTASLLLRGVALAQVPTTLLAQVDASVGGKTAVNLAAGKNLLGTFHQPVLVFADLSTLGTLPPRDLRAGLAEVAKHALLVGDPLLPLLETRAEAARDGDADLLADLVARSCAYKAGVVGGDERERRSDGGRVLLNLGHTVGHALEAASLATDDPLRHGEAVALGLIAAARLGASLGGSDLEPRVTALLARLGLPVDLDARLAAGALSAIAADKKRAGGRLRVVVLDGPGRPRVVPLDASRLVEALAPAH